jgi:predicted phosphohydrolase
MTNVPYRTRRKNVGSACVALGDIFNVPPEPQDPENTRGVDADGKGKIFQREMGRLELSLQQIPDQVETRIAIVHNPPTDPSLSDTIVTSLLERYGVTLCLFGHLHNVREGIAFSGLKNGIRYELTSADFLNLKLLELSCLLPADASRYRDK